MKYMATIILEQIQIDAENEDEAKELATEIFESDARTRLDLV